jgi:hypothetical protein
LYEKGRKKEFIEALQKIAKINRKNPDSIGSHIEVPREVPQEG